MPDSSKALIIGIEGIWAVVDTVGVVDGLRSQRTSRGVLGER